MVSQFYFVILLVSGCDSAENANSSSNTSGSSQRIYEITPGDDLTYNYRIECRSILTNGTSSCDHDVLAKRVCEDAGYFHGSQHSEKLEPFHPDGSPIGELDRTIASGVAVCRTATFSYRVECRAQLTNGVSGCDHGVLAKRACENTGLIYVEYGNENLEPFHSSSSPIGELDRMIASGDAVCRFSL